MTELQNLSNESSPKNHMVGRPKKKAMFEDNRIDIIKKINNILNISDTNNTFILYDLENDTKKQDMIIQLESDIKKFFACSHWSYFNAKNTKREYLSLLRSIYKSMGYDVVRKSIKIKVDDKFISSQLYYIIKKNI